MQQRYGVNHAGPAALLTIFCATGVTAAGMSASLTLEPSHVLPGIAPAVHVVVANDGEVDAVMPRKLLLRVIPAEGAAFIAEWGAGQEQRFSNARLPGELPAKIEARSRHEFVFRSYSLDGVPGWFYDARLNTPGTYRLQLLMLDSFSESAVFKADALTIENAMPVAIVSTEAVLTIDTPGGKDAELWRRLTDIAKKRGGAGWTPLFWGFPGWQEFVQEAVDEDPSSPYAPLVMRDYAQDAKAKPITSEERLSKAERILKAQPMTPAREDLQLFIAQMEVRVAQRAASQPTPDMKRAADYYERARADYQALERTARNPDIKERAREEREHIPDMADLREPEKD